MNVIYLASDESDEDESSEIDHLKYQFIPDEHSTRSEGKYYSSRMRLIS